MRKILILCVLIAGSVFTDLFAQRFTVTARIDSSTIWIGNQTKLSFEISQQPGQIVIPPVFTDTIGGGLEVVEALKPDTAKSPDGHLLINHRYTVTAFEDSLYYIPPYPFVLNGDTVWSKSLSLKVVEPFVIDTTSKQIADIKPVMTPKFYWKGLIRTVLVILLIIILLISGFFIIRYFVVKKPTSGSADHQPHLPPYEIALQRLDKLKQQKPWQQNRFKEYHTDLTDVLRQYIEATFDIPCMEMTSEEIFEHLNHLKFENKDAYLKLQQILRLADLVKFAKWNPGPDENELSLYNAYTFVNVTKVAEEPVTEESKAEEKPE